MPLTQIEVSANAVIANARMCQRVRLHLLTAIRIIATRSPITEQISPPRDPVRSKPKKHVRAAADRTTIFIARASLLRDNSNMRIVESRSDCREEKAKPNHRIPPAPTKVAAVL